MLKRNFLTALLAILLLMPLAAKALAADSVIDFNRDGSVSVTLKTGSGGVSGAELKIYRVAEIEHTAELKYTFVKDFDDSGIQLNDFGAETAAHLAAHAANHGISGEIQLTDMSGMARFESLPLGLYLVVQTGSASNCYPIEPFLVSVPMTSDDGSSWVYSVDATPKVEVKPTHTSTTELTVKKVWQGGTPPESITVTLLCDGEPYDRAELSSENNWLCRWNALSSEHTWRAVESDVPEGYTVSYSESETEITITNTAEEPPENKSLTVKKLWSDGNSPARPQTVKIELLRDSTPFDSVILSDENNWQHTWNELAPEHSWGVREPDVPEGYTATYTVENGTVTVINTAKTLIQTGQLNLPIPILLSSGGAIFAIGAAVTLVKRRRSHEK